MQQSEYQKQQKGKKGRVALERGGNVEMGLIEFGNPSEQTGREVLVAERPAGRRGQQEPDKRKGVGG